MDRRFVLIIAAAVAAGLAWIALSDPPPPDPAPPAPVVPQPVAPAPVVPAPPAPMPTPTPTPRCPRWDVASRSPVGEPEPMVDLLAMPSDHRKANIASRGSGCCTYRTAEYLARWCGSDVLNDLPEWMRSQNIAGGGWPEKQAQVIAKCAAARGKQAPRFAQYSGANYADVIERILKSGRGAGVTWQSNHMLACVHLDSERCGILDNNAPNKVQWFTRAEGLRRIGAPRGQGWAFAITEAPPPPPPSGAKADLKCDIAGCKCGCRDGDDCRCAVAARRPLFPRFPFPRRPRPWRPRPKPAPKVCDVVVDEEATVGGVQWAPETDAREVYSICGREVTREQFEDEFPDDSARLHVTTIGPARPELASLGDRYLCQTYPVGHWALQPGFVQQPGVYFQRRDGRVLLRTSLVGPALLEALRKADPSYNPNADPNGQPTPPPAPQPAPGPNLDAARDWLRGNRGLVLGGLAAAAGAWWLTRQQATPPAPATGLDAIALQLGRQQLQQRGIVT